MAKKKPPTKPANSAKVIIDEILGVDPRGDHPSKKRSPKWPKVMHAYLAEHPTCECCGAKKGLNIHHVIPYHLAPERELDPTNLITLCVTGHDCHLLIGHAGQFAGTDPFVREIAGLIRKLVALDTAALKLIHAKNCP
jgi:5-methylcytosine-specific restriction endonuclease McrA